MKSFNEVVENRTALHLFGTERAATAEISLIRKTGQTLTVKNHDSGRGFFIEDKATGDRYDSMGLIFKGRGQDEKRNLRVVRKAA